MNRQLAFEQLQAEFNIHALHKSKDRLSVGHDRLDAALAGGLLRRRVHLVRGDMPSSLATAFTLALVSMVVHQAEKKGPIVWCGPARGGHAGQLFGAGLLEMGLRPEQFIFVREAHPLRRIAAFEEALSTAGLSAVINEYGPLYEKPDLWQKSARRLQLACERGSATAFMIGAAGSACGFETGWHIKPSTHQHISEIDWRPVWDVQLSHARGGYAETGRLLWDRSTHRLQAASDRDYHSLSSAPSWQNQPYQSDKKTAIWRQAS